MKLELDIEALLAPVPGDDPSGEDLRYSQTYEDLKEARRADDPLERGDWQREVKTSDWDKVISIAVDALTRKTKDLQIAAWLTEALTNTAGFEGLAAGLLVLKSLLRNYWETVYPLIEDGDLDFRAAPFEFLNEKVWVCVKEVPLTDPSITSGLSFLKWQESRAVGYEADTHNRYGDVDESKKKARDEKISEGKPTAEEFDSSVALSSASWFGSLAAEVAACREEIEALDQTVDEKFGSSNAPSLLALKEAIQECERVIAKALKEKKGRDRAPIDTSEAVREAEPQTGGGYFSRIFKKQRERTPQTELQPERAGGSRLEEQEGGGNETGTPTPPLGSAPVAFLTGSPLSDTQALEQARWEEALLTLKSSGIKDALEQLLSASCSAPSVRERNRYRLLIAKMCLRAERPDLARPILDELNALIEELHLERWESPIWIAEVLNALYQCLTMGEPSDDDMNRARALFQKLCTTDITKAMDYRY